MKSSDRKRVARKISSIVPNLVEKGKLLVLVPRGRILRGFYIEDSNFSADRFYLTVFVQPLYVPSETVHFGFSERLGGGSHFWSPIESDLDALVQLTRDRGLRFLKGTESPSGLAATLVQRKIKEPYAIEAIAYSLLLANRFPEAGNYLRELSANLNPQIPWQAAMKERADQLLQASKESAESLLDTWEQQTTLTLRLNDIQ